jgi:hypothetical protein
MVHAFIFDVIICCPATYAERQKTVTNRNAGYVSLRLGELKNQMSLSKLFGVFFSTLFGA